MLMLQREPAQKGLRADEPFNPYGRFDVQRAIVAHPDLSNGAKLLYSALTYYAGTDGSCYPSVPSLASDLAVSDRQIQIYIAELVRHGFLRREAAFDANQRQTSNNFLFIWTAWLEARTKTRVKDSTPVKYFSPQTSPATVKTMSLTSVKASSPLEENQKEENQKEEMKKYSSVDQQIARNPQSKSLDYDRLLAESIQQAELEQVAKRKKLTASDAATPQTMVTGRDEQANAPGAGKPPRTQFDGNVPGSRRSAFRSSANVLAGSAWWQRIVGDKTSQ